MNYNVGRKVPVYVVFTLKMLERLDEIAAAEANGGEANRSEVIRRLVGEGLERMEGARASRTSD